MGRQVVHSNPHLPGFADELALKRLVQSFQVHAEGRSFYVNRFPTKEERQQLAERAQMIRGQLTPAVQVPEACAMARVALAIMFDGYPSLLGADKPALVEAYLFVLQKYPRFAIEKAIEDVGARRLVNHDPRFVPNSAQVGAAAARHVETVAREAITIDQVLGAKFLIRQPDKPGARERIMASLKDFHGRIEPVSDGSMLTPAEKTRAAEFQRKANVHSIMREWAQLGLEPHYDGAGNVMSPAMCRKLGILTGPEGAVR